jgi:hypothetical protein
VQLPRVNAVASPITAEAIALRDFWFALTLIKTAKAMNTIDTTPNTPVGQLIVAAGALDKKSAIAMIK